MSYRDMISGLGPPPIPLGEKLSKEEAERMERERAEAVELGHILFGMPSPVFAGAKMLTNDGVIPVGREAMGKVLPPSNTPAFSQWLADKQLRDDVLSDFVTFGNAVVLIADDGAVGHVDLRSVSEAAAKTNPPSPTLPEHNPLRVSAKSLRSGGGSQGTEDAAAEAFPFVYAGTFEWGPISEPSQTGLLARTRTRRFRAMKINESVKDWLDDKPAGYCTWRTQVKNGRL